MLYGSGVEFFRMDNEFFVIEDGSTKPFHLTSSSAIQLLRQTISECDVTSQALEMMHPGCEMSQLKQFASCRFGGLDYSADLKDGQLQEGEYWDCPMRGNCFAEGVLCTMPIVNGHQLSSIEIRLMQLLCSDMINEVIAEQIGIPMGTFHRDKKQLYRKFNVQTKQELTIQAIIHNLI